MAVDECQYRCVQWPRGEETWEEAGMFGDDFGVYASLEKSAKFNCENMAVLHTW